MSLLLDERPNLFQGLSSVIFRYLDQSLIATRTGFQDREDDIKAGLKSTAVLFGSHARIILTFLAAVFVACLFIAGVANRQGMWYFVVSVGGAASHLTWQLYTVSFEDKKDCWKKFLVRCLAHILIIFITNYLHLVQWGPCIHRVVWHADGLRTQLRLE